MIVVVRQFSSDARSKAHSVLQRTVRGGMKTCQARSPQKAVEVLAVIVYTVEDRPFDPILALFDECGRNTRDCRVQCENFAHMLVA